MVFWLSAGICAYWLYPKLISGNLFSVVILLSMEVACYVVSVTKFKRETCRRAYLSKLWGITLLVAFTALIGFGKTGVFFNTCFGSWYNFLP